MNTNNNKKNQPVNETKKSPVVLTLLTIFNILMFICCFQDEFRSNISPALFYIYIVLAILYGIFSFFDAFKDKKDEGRMYKMVVSIINLLLVIGVVIVFNLSL